MVDARVLERKPPANDASDAPKPADRKQPIKCKLLFQNVVP